MGQRFWQRDVFELADSALQALLGFWKEEVWPLLMGVSFFFFLAVPLLLVLLVFWYLDAIGWAPEHGRYKVGVDSNARVRVISASLTSGARLTQPAWAVSAPAPSASNADTA